MEQAVHRNTTAESSCRPRSGSFFPHVQEGSEAFFGKAPAHVVQRTVHSGSDHAGRFQFDDTACTLNYDQNWFYQFPSSMNAAQQTAYMAAAESQVEGVWSHRHRLKPDSPSCPCHAAGVDVNVDLHNFNEARNDRHGYDVNVEQSATSGFTNQPLRTVTLADTHDTPVNLGATTQQRIAHEFGHTLGITDEYIGWAAMGFGHSDTTSIMHSGDDVRPRHYQPFADLISNQIEGCQYHPEGFSSRALVNPVAQLGVTGGLTLQEDPDFIIDLRLSRRLGDADIAGLVTPRLGFEMLFNTGDGNFMFGPTMDFSLNRLAHPLYVDIGTGLLFDPEDPGRPASLNIPLSATVGARWSGFSAGIGYTGLIDVLGNSPYTHLLGVNFQFDVEGGGR